MTTPTPAPDYKKLYEQTLFHLRCVSGSRNSFTPEANKLLFSPESLRLHLTEDEVKNFRLRTREVDKMHMDAVEWLRIHDK